ncbi:hypothetical protein ACFE04_027218 [Oxalis oulophora]
MASSLAVKRATSSLFSKFHNPIRSASVVRSLTTLMLNSPITATMIVMLPSIAGSLIAPSLADDEMHLLASFQVLNLMDRIVDDPFLSRASAAGGSRMPWNAKEDENALYLRMDMPGLGKEDVKVCVEQNTLIIKGEGEKESGDEEVEQSRRVSSRIDLPPNVYKVDEIKAEMKNGVLKVVVPKVKEDDKMKNVLEINVE